MATIGKSGTKQLRSAQSQVAKSSVKSRQTATMNAPKQRRSTKTK